MANSKYFADNYIIAKVLILYLPAFVQGNIYIRVKTKVAQILY
jgi:hypothetical protein